MILATHNCRFQHLLVRNQRRLHLYRRNPLPADFEHVVRAPAVPEIAVLVLVIFVAGLNPGAENRILRALVLIPVLRAGAIAGDEEVTNLALRHLLALLVHNARLITRHERTGAARLYLARLV